MADYPICAECMTPIEPDPPDFIGVPELRVVDGTPYHWSCAQEMFSREHHADEREAEEH